MLKLRVKPETIDAIGKKMQDETAAMKNVYETIVDKIKEIKAENIDLYNLIFAYCINIMRKDIEPIYGKKVLERVEYHMIIIFIMVYYSIREEIHTSLKNNTIVNNN